MNQPQDHMEGAPLIRPSTTDHPLYEQVVSLNSQNQKLRAARDLLLPRLMSGEIAV